jgi:hypothetical protein
LSVAGADSNINAALSSKGTGSISLNTNGGAQQQMVVSHTSNAVNFVQVTGAATGNNTTISAQGSDAAIGVNFQSKGTSGFNFFSGAGSNRQLRIDGTITSVNYLDIWGGASGSSPSLRVAGSDTNISQVFQSKGTGAINLAPGSSGVNISNGGTVTALTRTNAGSGYTSIPAVAISAPTTAGGVQATASVTAMLAGNPTTVQAGGTGYTVGNTLTVVGGTPTGAAATYQVTAVSGGVVTAVTAVNFASYSVLPSNPVSTTGGTGTGATLNLTYGVAAGQPTITNAGSGYVEQPTVTFSGGGGSGAAAYATVGGGAIIRSIGTTGTASLDFHTPSSASNNAPILRLRDVNTGTSSNTGYIQLQNANGYTQLVAQGPSTVHLNIASNGDGRINFNTRSTSEVTQMRVSDTASAVNFVQVTGAATGGQCTLSMQGSDSSVGAIYTTKGAASHQFRTNSTAQTQMFITHTANAVNRITVTGAVAGSGPVYGVEGTDTNIDLALTPKGTGLVRFGTYTASMALTVQGFIEVKDSGGTIRKLAVIA